jgi:hypothetical protein
MRRLRPANAEAVALAKRRNKPSAADCVRSVILPKRTPAKKRNTINERDFLMRNDGGSEQATRQPFGEMAKQSQL